ncbi:MAG: ATP/cobalamin adenosyltransferase [Candidatus Roizmanbacteria bacterium GW2011_GWA2_35_8]|uniref:Corrinoid adenosyltransferase n=1 Tax=Candidatus Roizmanbacteria bacterium GW2011_GWA2_35_8 TaxID=1618479 RepID=A0A0G0D1C6_9BACT|nr:MAG: ATP/cobalamin adenosyltransferase [Candidatus Roizmanbacteria bacterium GW2011_GWA2_35_8]
MPIYTRTGDKGETSLYGGKRISKADCQVETYGTIDELTSFIGLLIIKIKKVNDKKLLIDIQKDLYRIMGFLSGAKIDLSTLKTKVIDFEKQIDSIEKKLPKLHKFILPGGNEISSLFHVVRVLCRKAERRNIDFFNQSTIGSQQLAIIKYLNRLSDLFFVMARKYGQRREVVL